MDKFTNSCLKCKNNTQRSIKFLEDLHYLNVSEENINISAGRESTSVASADRDGIVGIQSDDFATKNLLDFFDLLTRNPFLKILKMFQTNFLSFRK